MNDDTIIKAVKTPYDRDVHLSLLKRLKLDYDIDNLIEQITQERNTLYNVIINDKLIGVFIIRVEKQIDDTTELVVLHAVSGLRQQIPFIVIIEPLISDIAKQSKCKYIRMHSDSPALNRLMEKHTHYKISETIYSKEL